LLSLEEAKKKALRKLPKDKVKVFVGGSYDLMVILREICKFVKESGFYPVLAYDYEVSREDTHKFTLWLLDQCEYAIFELSKLDGHLMEIQHALEENKDVFVFYQVLDKEHREPPRKISSMLTTSGVPALGYSSIGELKEIVSSIFPDIEADRGGTLLRLLRSSWLPPKLKPRVYDMKVGQLSMDGIPRIDVFPKGMRDVAKELIAYSLEAYPYPKGISGRLARKLLNVFKRQEDFYYIEDVFLHREVLEEDLRSLVRALSRLRRFKEDVKISELCCALAVALSRLLPSKDALGILEGNKPSGKYSSLVFEYKLRLAHEFYRLGEYERAFSELRKALSKVRRREGVCRARLLQVSILIDRFEYEKADRVVRKVLKDCADVNVRMQAKFLWAYLLGIMGEYGEALKQYEELLRKNPRASLELAIHNNMGIAYLVLGRMKSAENEFRKCLQLSEKDTYGMASALGNLGIVFMDKGELEKAREYYEKALEIHRELGNKLGMANQLGNLGNVFMDKGELEKAREYHEKALEIHRELGNKLGMASALGNLGNVFRQLGELEKAREYHEKALEIHRELGNKLGMANQLGNLGNVFAQLGELEKAREYHEKALKLDEELGNKLGMAQDYGNLGNVFAQLGELEKALQSLKESVKLFTQLNLTNQAEKIKKVIDLLKHRGTKINEAH